MSLKPHRVWRKVILVLYALMLFSVGIGGLPSAAQIDNRTVFWRRWDVTLQNFDLNANRFDVIEIYEVEFGGTFRFGSANIPATNLEGFSDVQVYENGRALREGCTQTPGTFCASDLGHELAITYFFQQPITNDSQLFEVRYTVHGALRSYEGGDQLWWTAVPYDKFGFRVGQSTVRVKLPDGVMLRSQIDPVATYGAEAVVSIEGSQITARTVNGVGADDTLEIRVQYPHNPAMIKPSWQDAFDRDQQLRPLIDLGAIVTGVVVGLAGSLAVFSAWYTRGRDPEVGIVPEYLSEPPSDLPPAIVGALVDETADVRDVLSTLIDLAQRGYVVIEEDRKQGFLGSDGGSEFTFKRTDKSIDSLREFEKAFVRAFFGSGGVRTMDSLKNKFYTSLPNLQRDLYRELVTHKFFTKSPEDIRSGWIGLSAILLMLAGVAGFILLNLVDEQGLSAALLCIPGGFLVVAAALMVAGANMPRKTALGAQEAAKWQAFRKYLMNLEKYRSVEDAAAADQFEAYLPYAVALGIDRQWIRRFARLETMPMPTWYYPVYRGGHWGRGYTAGSPLGRELPGGIGLPGEVARAGGGLESLSGGISGGLESISDSLTNMLNSAGAVMTSKPSSSSSGGFSGGGLRGGASGGGSRGFG